VDLVFDEPWACGAIFMVFDWHTNSQRSTSYITDLGFGLDTIPLFFLGLMSVVGHTEWVVLVVVGFSFFPFSLSLVLCSGHRLEDMEGLGRDF